MAVTLQGRLTLGLGVLLCLAAPGFASVDPLEEEAAQSNAYFDGAPDQLGAAAQVTVPAAKTPIPSPSPLPAARGEEAPKPEEKHASDDGGPWPGESADVPDVAAPAAPDAAGGAGGAPPAKPEPPTPPLVGIPGSEWKLVGSVGDSIGDSNPSSREKQDFWDKLRDKSFWFNSLDMICKDIELPAAYDLSLGEIFHARTKVARKLHPGLDGGMLIIDRAEVDLSVSKGLPVVNDGPLPLSFGTGVNIQGHSFVIRPLKEPRACRDLLALVDFRTIKTVYPLSHKRFPKMQDGEIWQLPLTLSASLSVGGGVPLDPAGVANFSISWGYSRSGAANVTLRRMDVEAEDPEHPGQKKKKKTLRVRIRLDHVRVTGPNVGATATLPATQFSEFEQYSDDFFSRFLGNIFPGVLGKNTVARWASDPIKRQVRNWLNEYFTGRVGWMAQFVRGDHALIEFELNPNDEKQMQGLEELLSGGKFQVLDSLFKRLRVAGEALVHRHDLTGVVLDWRQRYQEALAKIAKGVKSFTGTDKVESDSTSFNLKLPIVWDYSRSAEKSHDFITVLDDSGGRFDSYKSRKDSSHGFMHLPFVGDYAKHNQSRSVMAFSYAEKGGTVVGPTLVFVQQDGFVNKSERAARRLVRSADSVMRLAGVRGRGVNDKTALPLATVFPEQDTGYRRGLGAFTLVLSAQGVEQVLSAPPEDVIRAFTRAQEDSAEARVLNWAFAHAEMTQDGRLRCPDPRESPDFPYRNFQALSQGSPPNVDADGFAAGVRAKFNFAIRLARQLHEVARLRAPGSQDPEAARQQALAFKGILAGAAGNGVRYEDMLRILIQLADPRHVTAEVVVQATPKGKGKTSIGGTYLYNRGLSDDPTLKELYKTLARFNPPSDYSD